MTDTLRAEAIAAYAAQQSDESAGARALLADTLTPADVSTLAVQDTEPEPGFTRYVFTDGDLHLAVVMRGNSGEVHLVEGSLGAWTDLATVTSLAQLGKVLPKVYPPQDTGTGVPEWQVGVSYAPGDLAAYDGITYQCIEPNTAQIGWEPPNVPALWEVAA